MTLRSIDGGAAAAISIHIPRVGDDLGRIGTVAAKNISIHIPRVGDDPSAIWELFASAYFNPHPPCGG